MELVAATHADLSNLIRTCYFKTTFQLWISFESNKCDCFPKHH